MENTKRELYDLTCSTCAARGAALNMQIQFVLRSCGIAFIGASCIAKQLIRLPGVIDRPYTFSDFVNFDAPMVIGLGMAYGIFAAIMSLRFRQYRAALGWLAVTFGLLVISSVLNYLRYKSLTEGVGY